MPEMNRQITLAQRPYGFPKPSDYKLVETPIPNPGEGELLIRNEYMSVDPTARDPLRYLCLGDGPKGR